MSDELARTLAAAIRAERGRAGWSQHQLAERMGWSRQVVSAVETGRRRVYADELADLCRALGCTLSVLLVTAAEQDRAVLTR